MSEKNITTTIKVAIAGAGPAGLTAAYELAKRNVESIIIESDSVPGGLSRTELADNWRFDIGGHRFFTKVKEVENFWHEILPGSEDLKSRPRLSRIYYEGKFFDYPLQPFKALKTLGIFESIKCLLSFVVVKFKPPKDLSNYENYVAHKFGWRLYRTFFKSYTEKVWGIDASLIQADWAAQRIKNLSIGNLILHSIPFKKNKTGVTSLIEEFLYPKFGPGQMWETTLDKALKMGAAIKFNNKVVRITKEANRAVSVTIKNADGEELNIDIDYFISSMPLRDLVLAIQPSIPSKVVDAAKQLTFRDHLLVALVVNDPEPFPDNWIYIHYPKVKVGRIQNYGAWSPDMVKAGTTCLGMEYFVNQGDELWSKSEMELIEMAKRELAELELVDSNLVDHGYVVKMPNAYPVYNLEYKANVDLIKNWLNENLINVFPVGRNGMHRYNNQDHSMYTAMLAVDNIFGARNDIWSVNVDSDYHEIKQTDSKSHDRTAPIFLSNG